MAYKRLKVLWVKQTKFEFAPKNVAFTDKEEVSVLEKL